MAATYIQINLNPKANNHHKEIKMAKNSGGSKGSKGGGRPPATPPRPGGNWPSTTGNKSGGDRGNAIPKGK